MADGAVGRSGGRPGAMAAWAALTAAAVAAVGGAQAANARAPPPAVDRAVLLGGPPRLTLRAAGATGRSVVAQLPTLGTASLVGALNTMALGPHRREPAVPTCRRAVADDRCLPYCGRQPGVRGASLATSRPRPRPTARGAEGGLPKTAPLRAGGLAAAAFATRLDGRRILHLLARARAAASGTAAADGSFGVTRRADGAVLAAGSASVRLGSRSPPPSSPLARATTRGNTAARRSRAASRTLGAAWTTGACPAAWSPVPSGMLRARWSRPSWRRPCRMAARPASSTAPSGRARPLGRWPTRSSSLLPEGPLGPARRAGPTGRARRGFEPPAMQANAPFGGRAMATDSYPPTVWLGGRFDLTRTDPWTRAPSSPRLMAVSCRGAGRGRPADRPRPPGRVGRADSPHRGLRRGRTWLSGTPWHARANRRRRPRRPRRDGLEAVGARGPA